MNEEHIPAHTPETAESHEAAKPAPRRKVPARATRTTAEAVPEPEPGAEPSAEADAALAGLRLLGSGSEDGPVDGAEGSP